jgi:hypothetical protein
MASGDLHGVGLGLRFESVDEILERLDRGDPELGEIAFFEVSPENVMRRGGFLPAAVDRVRERFPVLSHGLMMSLGGLDPLDPGYFHELRRYHARLRPPFHSDHLSFSGSGGRILHDLLPLPVSRASARRAVARAREAQDRLGLPFALENITHYLLPGGLRDPLDEASFLADVVEEAGVGLLLDVNNVFVNAHNYGFDARAFLERLPLDRVVEIHVAGHETEEESDLLIDTHGATMIDPVLELLAFAVARTGPVPVLLERDHALPDVDGLLAEVRRARAAYERGLAFFEGRRPGAPVHAGFADPPEPDEALLEALTARMRAPGPAPRGRADVYRRHVRAVLGRGVARQIPRTAARLGDGLAGWVERFLAEEAPRSRYFRDVAFELVAWAAPRWAADPALPGYLGDLARHELAMFDAATADPGEPAEEREIALDRPLRFHASARLVRHEHAVQALSVSPGPRAAPDPRAPSSREEPTDDGCRREPTALFLYRDEEHDARCLALTPAAAAIVERLLGGEALGAAITGAAAALGLPLDGALTASAAALLDDLRARGAVLGGA